jgi:hypothetical protein
LGWLTVLALHAGQITWHNIKTAPAHLYYWVFINLCQSGISEAANSMIYISQVAMNLTIPFGLLRKSRRSIFHASDMVQASTLEQNDEFVQEYHGLEKRMDELINILSMYDIRVLALLTQFDTHLSMVLGAV